MTLKRWKGGDGLAYAVVVAEFRTYLDTYYPEPDTKKIPAPDASAVADKSGIIGFVFQYSGGTGHFSLWDGTQVLYGDYFGTGDLNHLWANMEITFVRQVNEGALHTLILRHAPK